MGEKDTNYNMEAYQQDAKYVTNDMIRAKEKIEDGAISNFRHKNFYTKIYPHE